MKQLLVITPHSILDVITNSSTELFVCDTDKTIGMVKDILAADPNVYGYEEPWIFDLKKYREWREKDRQRHIDIQSVGKWIEEDDPYISYSCIEGWFYDDEDLKDLEYLRKHYIEEGDHSRNYWGSDNTPFGKRLYSAEDKAENNMLKNEVVKKAGEFNSKIWSVRHDARKMEIQKIYDETAALNVKPDWWVNPLNYYYNTQPVSSLDGKIIILGEGDNSIPYDHFDWIENTFNASRHHLG